MNFKFAKTLILLSLILICLSSLILNEKSIFGIMKFKKEFLDLKKSNQEMRYKNKKLFIDINRFNKDKAFQEDIIRKEMGMLKKNEVIIKLPKK